MAAALGDQQADHRGRPLRRRRGGVRAGLVADEAVLPHRLPTETDEDTLGIAELARNCVAIGRRHTEPGVGDGERRRVRAQAAHAVPVVRAEHRGRAAAQGRAGARRTRRNVNLKWHDPAATRRRGHRQPRRPPHRAGHRAGVGEPAARSRSGASTSTSRRWTGDGGRGPVARLVRAPPPRSDEVLPWDHLTAGLHEDFLWDDWQAALAPSGVEDCRWTPCYDCGCAPGTASSTSWRRRRRRRAAARAPVRISTRRCPASGSASGCRSGNPILACGGAPSLAGLALA